MIPKNAYRLYTGKEKIRRELTIDEKIDTVVGYVIHKGKAIDFTPIITFVIQGQLHSGDIIEWDNANNKIIYKGNNLNKA